MRIPLKSTRVTAAVFRSPKFLFVAALVGLSAACISPPPSSQSQAAPTSSGQATQSTRGTKAERLHQECLARRPLACSVLAASYAKGGGYASTPQDYSKAAYYSRLGCDAESLNSCHRYGEMVLAGQGVVKDERRALEVFRKACAGTDEISPFACLQAGKLLIDGSGSIAADRELAIEYFQRGCAVQPSICSFRDIYAGTGYVSTTTPPSGAVGFFFGVTRDAALASCSHHGGTFSEGSSGGGLCDAAVKIPGLDLETSYVGLEFCNGGLCFVSVRISVEAKELLVTLGILKDQLIDRYGSPGSIEYKLPRECSTISTIAGCIEDGRARYRVDWQWGDGQMLQLAMTASGGAAGASVNYGSPALLERFDGEGL